MLRMRAVRAAAIAVLMGAAGAHAQSLPRSEPVENPYEGHPFKGPMSPTYYRLGRPYYGPYRPILHKMGNLYSGPADPNCGQPYFGLGYVANLPCDPTRGNAYYSMYYNDTTGTYYGPSSWLQQSLMIYREPPPSHQHDAGCSHCARD